MELGRGDDRALAQDFARGCTREVVFGGWSANIDASQASQGLAGGRSLPRPRAPVGGVRRGITHGIETRSRKLCLFFSIGLNPFSIFLHEHGTRSKFQDRSSCHSYFIIRIHPPQGYFDPVHISTKNFFKLHTDISWVGFCNTFMSSNHVRLSMLQD